MRGYISTSRRAAELIKYASNAFLATKVTFINELANLCEKTNINVEDISIGMGLDKRIGMLVMNLAGTKVRNVVLGILVGTAIPSAFISEASIAPMFLPIAMALYTLTSKKIGDATQLGKLLMMSIAIGCMVGAPMSPTGGARNAIMLSLIHISEPTRPY